MRVLITGGAGFLGLSLVRTFARAGHSVVAADRALVGEFAPRIGTPLHQVTYLTCDVSKRDDVLALPVAGVEAVVHAAALTPTTEESWREPERLVDVNLGGTVNLLAWARRQSDCRRFLYLSSSAVYDGSRGGLLREADADGGSSLYGAAKLAGEYLVHRYGEMFGIETAAVRPASLYGPGERVRPSRRFVSQIHQLVHAACQGVRVRVEGREARNDWLYVDDAAEAIMRVVSAAQMPRGAFTLSSAQLIPFREVVDSVAAVLPLTADPDADTLVDGNPDRSAVMMNDRISAAIDWAPRSPADGIADYAQALEAERVPGVASGG
jgi:UDP-glucose 4-epimerase